VSAKKSPEQVRADQEAAEYATWVAVADIPYGDAIAFRPGLRGFVMPRERPPCLTSPTRRPTSSSRPATCCGRRSARRCPRTPSSVRVHRRLAGRLDPARQDHRRRRSTTTPPCRRSSRGGLLPAGVPHHEARRAGQSFNLMNFTATNLSRALNGAVTTVTGTTTTTMTQVDGPNPVNEVPCMIGYGVAGLHGPLDRLRQCRNSGNISVQLAKAPNTANIAWTAMLEKPAGAQPYSWFTAGTAAHEPPSTTSARSSPTPRSSRRSSTRSSRRRWPTTRRPTRPGDGCRAAAGRGVRRRGRPRRFRKVSRQNRAKVEDWLKVFRDWTAEEAERPTGQPTDSSDGPEAPRRPPSRSPSPRLRRSR
jgi:hypothetical protein